MIPAHPSNKAGVRAQGYTGDLFVNASIPTAWKDVTPKWANGFVVRQEIEWRSPVKGFVQIIASVDAEWIDTDAPYDAPPHYEALRNVTMKSSEINDHWSAGELEAITIGELRGFVVKTPGVLKKGFGYTENPDRFPYKEPCVYDYGVAFLVNGRDLVKIQYRFEGQSKAFFGPYAEAEEVNKTYDSHLSFLTPKSEALHAEIRQIINSIWLAPLRICSGSPKSPRSLKKCGFSSRESPPEATRRPSDCP